MTGAPLRLPPWMDHADETVDRWWEPLRGRRGVDLVFYGASAAADFSALWHGINVVRVLRRRAGRRDLVRVAVGLGVESLVVNQGLKRLFRRARPERAADPSQPHLRTPSTSSFPSGHASSAVFASSLLGEGDRLRPVYRGLAAVVGTSRLHVRIHHASDVVAGALCGAVLVRVFRAVWPASR